MDNESIACKMRIQHVLDYALMRNIDDFHLANMAITIVFYFIYIYSFGMVLFLFGADMFKSMNLFFLISFFECPI